MTSSFIYSCCQGNKDIAEQLYELSKKNGNSKIDIHANNEEAFRLSCWFGKKNIAEWLYELSKKDVNSKIDIHINDEHIFRWLCRYGDKNMVEWLYELSKKDNNGIINIRAVNDEAFVYSCLNNNKNTAEWLCLLCDNYSITIENNKLIPHIENVRMILIEDNQKKIKQMLEKSKNEILNSEICMICLDNLSKYWVKLNCNHELCSNCFLKINKCPYRCKSIDLDNIKLIKN